MFIYLSLAKQKATSASYTDIPRVLHPEPPAVSLCQSSLYNKKKERKKVNFNYAIWGEKTIVIHLRCLFFIGCFSLSPELTKCNKTIRQTVSKYR